MLLELKMMKADADVARAANGIEMKMLTALQMLLELKMELKMMKALQMLLELRMFMRRKR